MKNKEKILHKMKEVNPNIKIDKTFKKELKNEILTVAKDKIKNKKTNIFLLDKGILNFFKILSPIFIGAFMIFGFINFYGQSLFVVDEGGNHDYRIKNIDEKDIDEQKINKENIKKEKVNKQEKVIKKMYHKKKQKINKQRKNIIEERIINKKENRIYEKTSEYKINNITKEKDDSINTELLDVLGEGENTENNNKDYFEQPRAIDSSIEDSDILNEVILPKEENVADVFKFEDFCKNKKGKIKNNICIYGEKECSLEEFKNDKCDKN